MKMHIIAGLVLISISASAADAIRVDAKKMLAIEVGNYKVSSSDSGFRENHLCNDGELIKIAWFGSESDPVLVVGAANSYSDFNLGLKLDASPAYANHCKYNHSTQVTAGHLVDETFANCDGENRTSREELTVKGKTIEYSAHTDISRAGKVVSIPSKCTLELQVKYETSPKKKN